MRADVKLGLVISVMLVSIAGGYFVFRGEGEKPIQVDPAAAKSGDRTPLKAADAESSDRSGKAAPAATRPASRQPSGPRNAASPRNTGAPDRQRPLVSRDGAGSPVTTPNDSPAVPKDAAKVADGGAAPPAGQNAGAPQTGGEVPVSSASIETVVDKAAGPVGRPETKSPGSGSTPPTSLAAGTPEPRPAVSLAAPVTTPTTARQQAPAESSAAVDIHRVQAGDTMLALAERYYGSASLASFLVSSNPQLPDPNRLSPGQTVRVPPRPQDLPASQAATKPTMGSNPPAVQPGRNTKAPRTYRVQPGDSFYKIARDQLGDSARWKELFELNKDLVKGDATKLKIGQVITLPGS